MNPDYYPLVNIGISLLIALLSIPLILRRVPMNSFYGVRFPESYKSDKSWYAINEFGGKALFLASLPILISGLWGCFANPRNYLITGSAIMVISLTAASVLSYINARMIDKQNG
ncbi:MAG: SdpI family protein [bacterium]